MTIIKFFLDYTQFVPRGHCGNWDENMLSLYMFSNFAIFLAYMVMAVLLRFVVVDYNMIARDGTLRVAFALFIFFCGIGHLEGILFFRYPVYHFSAVWHLLTALVSWAAVGLLMGRISAAGRFSQEHKK